MQPGKHNPGSGGQDREPREGREKNPPSSLASLSLEASGQTLLERLRRISEHSPGRDRYSVRGEIGRGGMGRVLRVWDEDLQREVALKEIVFARTKTESDEDSRLREHLLARFIAEARTTSQLDHPCIVPVHEIAINRRGCLYFTMPLVRGRNLQEVFELVRSGKRGWSLHRAVEVLVRVSNAVAYAHSKGIIHRDLKPANVMVGPFGEVYVMDWGLALLLDHAGQDGIVGTPAYMAPEQAVGDTPRVNERSDIYSLGAMLYELLAGRMPHETTLHLAKPGSGLHDIAMRPPRSLHEIDPHLPPELVAVCEKAMAPEQKHRYRSAMKFAEELQAWLEKRVVDAYATGRWERLKKWRSRNPGLCLALEALTVVAFVSGIVVFAVQQSKLTAVAAERDESQRNGYAAKLRAAELGFEQNGHGEAGEFLAACPPYLRDWAWRHLSLRADASILRMEQHSGPVRSVAFRMDGTRLATGSDDGSIHLWDPAEKTLVGVLLGHADSVTSVAFAPNGALLASGSEDGSIRLWDASSGTHSRQLGGHAGEVTALRFSPDGRRIVSGSHNGEIRVWDLEEGAVFSHSDADIPPANQPTVFALEWTSDDRILAALSDGRLLALRGENGASLASADLGSTPYALALRSDERILAAATLDDGVRLFDAHDLQPAGRMDEQSGRPRCLAYEPGGTRLLIGNTDGLISLWSENGQLLNDFRGHGRSISSLAFHPDGTTFVSGSMDSSARMWRVDHSASSSYAMATFGGWPGPRLHLQSGIVAGGTDEQSLYVAHLFTDAPTLEIATSSACSHLALHPDGRSVAVAMEDGFVRFFGTQSGELLRELSDSPHEVSKLSFDKSGTRLLTRGLDAILRLWDLESGVVLLELPDADNHHSGGLAFHPDGQRFVVGFWDGRIRVHDARSGALLSTLEGHDQGIETLSFPFDDDTLASGSQDGTAALWDLETGRRSMTFRGHKLNVNSLTATADGRNVFTGSSDGTVRVWDRENGTPLMTLRCGDFAVTEVAYAAGEDSLIAVDSTHRVHIWRTRVARE